MIVSDPTSLFTINTGWWNENASARRERVSLEL
jgi:hypothetical protein